LNKLLKWGDSKSKKPKNTISLLSHERTCSVYRKIGKAICVENKRMQVRPLLSPQKKETVLLLQYIQLTQQVRVFARQAKSWWFNSIIV
jgi:hypothetical protein